MNKEEAIKAMQDGKTIRHRRFTAYEIMSMYPNGDYRLQDDSIIIAHCTPEEFWINRQDLSWSIDWEIVS